jgi:hypothetical protein
MSLLNLKKSKPLAEPNLRSIEEFIDDALLYAQGKIDKREKLAKKASVKPVYEKSVIPIRKPVKAVGMRHATFTLTPQCIETLADISQRTGKAKSALIREWIVENSKN